jgi:hypothetical protein
MDLDARIARLERRNRVLTLVALTAALAAPLGLLLPRLAATEETKGSAIDVAERLVLLSATGSVAATLVSTPAGANLTLMDGVGRPRMVFAVGKDGPNLVFLDGNQAGANKGVRLALSANTKSGPSVALFGDDGAAPLATVRTKAQAGSTTSGVFVAVNDENRPVAFPKSTANETEEAKATTSSGAKSD